MTWPWRGMREEVQSGRWVTRSINWKCLIYVHVGIALICSFGSHVRIAIARIVIGYSSNQSSLSSYLCYPTALGWKKAISKSPSHQFRGSSIHTQTVIWLENLCNGHPSFQIPPTPLVLHPNLNPTSYNCYHISHYKWQIRGSEERFLTC